MSKQLDKGYTGTKQEIAGEIILCFFIFDFIFFCIDLYKILLYCINHRGGFDMEKLEKLLDTPQLAEYVGVTKYTIYLWRNEGMPAIRIGKYYRYEKDEVMQWLKNRK